MSETGHKAFIVSYWRGSNSQNERYILLEVEGVRSRAEASRLIGRKVVFSLSSKERVVGRIVRVHGGNGRVIAVFRKPLPGQALGGVAVVV